jgi:hypothetical protein
MLHAALADGQTRSVADDATTPTSTSASTNPTSLSYLRAEPSGVKGTIILIVGLPANMQELDLNYEIVIEVSLVCGIAWRTGFTWHVFTD